MKALITNKYTLALIIGAICLVAAEANAGGLQCTDKDQNKVDVVKQCPKVKERWRTVVKTVEVPKIQVVEKVVTKVVVKKVFVPIVDTKVVTRKLVRTKTKKVNVRKNHLSLLLGTSRTDLRVTDLNSHHVSKAEVGHEFDVGVQFMRELGRIHILGQTTIKGNGYIGVGLSW